MREDKRVLREYHTSRYIVSELDNVKFIVRLFLELTVRLDIAREDKIARPFHFLVENYDKVRV